MTTTNGVWQGDNPLEYSLPLFVVQLALVVLATRFFVFILRPFHQPRVMAEVLVRKIHAFPLIPIFINFHPIILVI